MAFWRIFDTIKKYPKFSFAVSLLLTAPIGNYGLKKRARSELVKPIDDTFEKGSHPSIPLQVKNHMIPRKKISEKIYDMYFPNKVSLDGDFGVVLGPSGSGKTVAVMDLCEKHPKGVLYMEIVEPEVIHYDLATCMGMRLWPTNIEDLILG